MKLPPDSEERRDFVVWICCVVVLVLTFPLTAPLGAVLLRGYVLDPMRGSLYRSQFEARAQELGSEDAALGNPPFRVPPPRLKLMVHEIGAALRFPDRTSCIAVRDGAERIAWDRIKLTEEAEVCIFRALPRGLALSQTIAWLDMQGLSVIRRDGLLSWTPDRGDVVSLQFGWGSDGPQFLDRRVFVWYNPLFRPYGQSFQVYFKGEGKQFIGVKMSYSYL